MQRFKNILCVVNTELNDTSALEHAAKLAANNQASLTVVEVIDQFLDPHCIPDWQLAGVKHAPNVAVAAGIDIDTEGGYRRFGHSCYRVAVKVVIVFPVKWFAGRA